MQASLPSISFIIMKICSLYSNCIFMSTYRLLVYFFLIFLYFFTGTVEKSGSDLIISSTCLPSQSSFLRNSFKYNIFALIIIIIDNFAELFNISVYFLFFKTAQLIENNFMACYNVLN